MFTLSAINIFRIVGVAAIISVFTYMTFKYIELKNLRTEVIKYELKEIELKQELSLSYKISDDKDKDFVLYQIEEEKSILIEQNITKEVKVKEYTYKNIFNKINKMEGTR